MKNDCPAHIPEKMLAWPLFGTGMEKLGKNDQPCEIPIPEIKDDELLVRIDAIGLCFSDVKLIKAGEKHPRVISKDLSTDFVIPGHEAVMTVVKVGKKYANRFKSGERYIIQADIYYQGKGLAYGYAINGGFAQYSVIDKRVIEGDECCYLLPLADSIPSAVAAMIEPWTCVIASYRIEKRKTPLAGGKMLIAGKPSDTRKYCAGKLLEANPPSEIHLLGISDQAVSDILKTLSRSNVSRINSIQEASTNEYDDIFICDMGNEKDSAEKIAALASRNALVSFVGNYKSEMWSFDVGAIHYKGWFYQGSESSDFSASYGRNVRSELKKGGSCWLVGGAGAMGQMHTQLAVEMANGPSRILVSDMDDARIQNVKKLLSETVAKKGIVFETLNPKHFPSPAEFMDKVAKFAETTGGFDDIVMLVPSVAVLNSCIPLMKNDALMNIFAGIPAGSSGLLDVGGICNKGLRFVGSSGSMTADLRYTLQLAEDGKINPATSLAAIGGMMQLKEGLKAVENARFPGKTVIFPNIKDLPLTQVSEIEKISPELAASLSNGLYNMQTEELLFAISKKVRVHPTPSFG